MVIGAALLLFALLLFAFKLSVVFDDAGNSGGASPPTLDAFFYAVPAAFGLDLVLTGLGWRAPFSRIGFLWLALTAASALAYGAAVLLGRWCAGRRRKNP
jgi:hypothetical protein